MHDGCSETRGIAPIQRYIFGSKQFTVQGGAASHERPVFQQHGFPMQTVSPG
jgi:hypothetical protein